MSDTKRLCIIVCAAGPARDVGELVDLAHERGWDVQIISTPAAIEFIDVEDLKEKTGHPVRSQHRKLGAPRSPKADAIIIAPATFNTINKLANGISDNYSMDVLSEALGCGVRTAILPFVNSAYANREVFKSSIEKLTRENVSIILGRDGVIPHAPGSGSEAQDEFPWKRALEALDSPAVDLPSVDQKSDHDNKWLEDLSTVGLLFSVALTLVLAPIYMEVPTWLTWMLVVGAAFVGFWVTVGSFIAAENLSKNRGFSYLGMASAVLFIAGVLFGVDYQFDLGSPLTGVTQTLFLFLFGIGLSIASYGVPVFVIEHKHLPKLEKRDRNTGKIIYSSVISFASLATTLLGLIGAAMETFS